MGCNDLLGNGMLSWQGHWLSKAIPVLLSQSLFFKSTDRLVSIIIMYVDDILITEDDKAEIIHITSFLNQEFKVKNLGDIHYFLRFEIFREEQGFIINQRKFNLELLQEFDHTGPEVSSFLDPYSKLTADDGPLLPNPTYNL